MRIKDELFGKEVLDADIQIVGKIIDVIFDKDSFELTDFVIKKTGLSEQIKASENIVPVELVKVIGDKVLLKEIRSEFKDYTYSQLVELCKLNYNNGVLWGIFYEKRFT